MIKSLRKKFILINMLLVSMVLILVFSMQYISRDRQIQERSLGMLKMAVERPPDMQPPRFEIGNPKPKEMLTVPTFVVQINKSGETSLLWKENIDISQQQIGILLEEVALNGSETGVIDEYDLRYLKKEEEYFDIVAFIDISDDILSMQNTLLMSLFSCIVSLAGFFCVSLFLSKWTLRPVVKVWEQQQQFIADASHELKTPLTVILANTNILKSNLNSTVQQQYAWLENTEEEAKRMKSLVDDLLFLAKHDNVKNRVTYSKVNLSDIVLHTVLTFETVAYEKGMLLQYEEIYPDIYIYGDDVQLKQLVAILLDNALKYSTNSDDVIIKLELKQAKAILTVHNKGSYLTQEESKYIFNRFYRVDPARTNKGTGLGLSIAKSIVETHSGKITVESEIENGTNLIVSMPVIAIAT